MRDHRSSLGALMEHLSHSLDSSVFVATNCISLIKSLKTNIQVRIVIICAIVDTIILFFCEYETQKGVFRHSAKYIFLTLLKSKISAAVLHCSLFAGGFFCAIIAHETWICHKIIKCIWISKLWEEKICKKNCVTTRHLTKRLWQKFRSTSEIFGLSNFAPFLRDLWLRDRFLSFCWIENKATCYL